MSFFYIYILKTIAMPERFYVGSTLDLRQRLAKHNAGGVPPYGKIPALADQDGRRFHRSDSGSKL